MKSLLFKFFIVLSFFTNCEKKCNNDLDYKIWKELVRKEIRNNTQLNNFHKENLLFTLEKVSKSKFHQLKTTLTTKGCDRVNYYLLTLSEGETVSGVLHYIQEYNGTYQHHFFNLYENGNIKKGSNGTDIQKLIEVEEINNESLLDELMILTKINKDGKYTIIGVRNY